MFVRYVNINKYMYFNEMSVHLGCYNEITPHRLSGYSSGDGGVPRPRPHQVHVLGGSVFWFRNHHLSVLSSHGERIRGLWYLL